MASGIALFHSLTLLPSQDLFFCSIVSLSISYVKSLFAIQGNTYRFQGLGSGNLRGPLFILSQVGKWMLSLYLFESHPPRFDISPGSSQIIKNKKNILCFSPCPHDIAPFSGSILVFFSFSLSQRGWVYMDLPFTEWIFMCPLQVQTFFSAHLA